MRKIVRYVLFSIESILIFLVVGALTTAITKNIHSDILIQNFKSKGVYNEEKSTNMTKVYEVNLGVDRPSYTMNQNVIMPGNTADIILGLTSEIQTPIVGEVVSFFAGGHSALVLGDYKDYYMNADDSLLVETTGLLLNFNHAMINPKDYWISSDLYKEVVVVRVDTTKEQRDKVISKALSLVGDLYNYSFIFDTKNKSYCTDLISKAYDSIGVNLNKDSFTTSVYDLLVSKESFISYYHYYDSDNVRHVYYSI